MRYLNLKLIRDIRNRWQQFFSVFLMSLLSVLIFVGLQGAWHGLEKSLDSYIKNSDLPTVWVQASNLTENDVDKIKKLQQVQKVLQKVKLTAEIDTGNKDKKYATVETFSDNSVVSVLEGKKISEEASDFIWLDQSYADANHLKVGDSISLTLQGSSSQWKIAGFVQASDKIYFTGSLEYIAPNANNYAYAYLSSASVKKKIGNIADNYLEIYSNSNDLRSDIETILGKKLVSYYDQSTLVEVSEATDRVGQIRNLSYLFSFIFVLLAILAMFTTIQRLIENQIKEIAILKAIGYSNYQVNMHYISFGFWISLCGVLVGLVCSPFMSWFVLETQKSMFSLPKWQIAYSFSAIYIVLLVLFICALSAYLASRKAVNGLPAIFLRGKEKTVSSTFVEKFPLIWRKLGYESRWAIRDSLRNRIRIVMGILGVAGSMMLLIAGIGMPLSMNHLVDKAYNSDFTYVNRLTVMDYDSAKATYSGQGVQIVQTHFSPDDGHNRLLIVFDEGDFINAKLKDGGTLSNDGIYVTEGFAKMAHLKVGQIIKVKPYQDMNEYQFEIKGIVTSETNQGAYISSKAFVTAGGNFEPHTLLLGNQTTQTKLSNDKNILSIISKSSQEKNAYDFVNSLMSVFLMIIGFALLLVVVVLYNLGSLNFVERTRDYATLRVLGVSNTQLQSMMMVENATTTFIGWILGIPLGIWFLKEYVATFSTIRIEYTAFLSGQLLVATTVLVWLTSLGTTYLFSRRIKTINMVEALKGVE